MKKNIILVIITGLFVSCGTASEAKSANYQENVNAAAKFFINGNYKNSASRLKRAVAQRPDSLNTHSKWIAWASMKSGAVDTALAYFEIASKYNQTDVDVIAGRAFALSIKAKVLSRVNANLLLRRSNVDAEQLINDADEWFFEYNINLSEHHLYLLEAQNYFSMGDFNSSYNYADDLADMLVDAEIVADSVRDDYFNNMPSRSTQAGQAGLAQAIEWLLGQL